MKRFETTSLLLAILILISVVCIPLYPNNAMLAIIAILLIGFTHNTYLGFKFLKKSFRDSNQ